MTEIHEYYHACRDPTTGAWCCGLLNLPSSLQPAPWIWIPDVRRAIELALEKMEGTRLVKEQAETFLTALKKHL